MKKNFSFLKKSALALGLMSLFSVGTYAADAKPYEAIWAAASSISKGDKVTFVDTDNKVVYNGDKSVVTYTDYTSIGGKGFTVQDGVNSSNAKSGYAFWDGTGYFTDLGTIVNQELTPEVSWSWEAGVKSIKSLSSSGRYIYYDSKQKYFMTTTMSSAACSLYKQFNVATAKFSNGNNTYASSTETINKVGVSKGNTWNLSITALAGKSGDVNYVAGDVYYRISIDGGNTWKVAWTKGTSVNLAADPYITRLVDANGKDITTPVTVTVEAKSRYAETGETSVQTAKFQIIEINPITWSVDNKTTNRVKDDGTYVVTAKSEKSTVETGLVLGTYTDDATIDIASKQDFTKAAGVSVPVYAKATRLGASIGAVKSYTVISNATSAELFGTFNTELAWDVTPLNDVNGNESFVAYYTPNAAYDYAVAKTAEELESSITLTTAAGKTYAPKHVTIDGAKIKVTVPYEIKNTVYTVTIPAGTFKATIKDAKDAAVTVNSFVDVNVQSGKYNAGNASVTYNIDPNITDVYVPSKGATVKATFTNVWPANEDRATTEVNPTASYTAGIPVHITDIADNILAVGTAVKVKDSKNSYEVTFPANDDVVAAMNTLDNSVPYVLVAFPAKSLVSKEGDQNGEVVTSRVRLIEEIGYVIANPDVCKHGNKLNVTVAATGKISGKAYTTSLNNSTVKVGDKDCAISGSNDKYVVDLTNLVKNGDYAVTYGDKLFAAFENTKGEFYSYSAKATQNFHLYAHPTFRYETVMGPQNKSMQVEVVASVPKGYNFKDGDLKFLDGKTKYLTIDGTRFDCDAEAVEVVNDSTQKIKLTVKNPSAAILKDGAHSFAIRGEILEAAGNETCLNPDATVSYEVKPWVTYSTDQTDIVSIDTKTVDVTFPVILKHGNNPVLYPNAPFKQGTITDKKPTIKLTYNDGSKECQATITDIVEVGNGKYNVTATLEAPLASRANNYELYVGQEAFFCDNYNFETFSVPFKVYNHIDIAANTPVDLTTSKSVLPVQLTGWDTVDEADATVNVVASTDSIWTLKGVTDNSTYTFKPVKGTKDGLYNLTLTKGADGKYLAEGEYTLTIPAKSVSAYASKNAEVLTVAVRVEDFLAKDITINQTDILFNVQVSNAALVKVNGVKVASINDTDEAKTLITDKATVATTDPQSNGVKIGLGNPLVKGVYTLTIPAYTLHGNYADNCEPLTCTVTVINECNFNDYANGSDKTTTLAKDVVALTYDTIHYERSFTGKFEALCLPFPITKEQADAAGLKIWRIVAAYTGAQLGSDTEKEELIVSSLKAGEKTAANYPYFVKGPQGNTHIDFFDAKNGVKMETPDVKAINCSSTKVTYTATGIIEAPEKLGNLATYSNRSYFIVKGGELQKFDKTYTSAYRPWRWVLDAQTRTANANVNYVKISENGVELDEEGESTGIEVVPSVSTSNGAIFNVAGQKMGATRKGINIINGHKVVIK